MATNCNEAFFGSLSGGFTALSNPDMTHVRLDNP